jgi:hypothetical protein
MLNSCGTCPTAGILPAVFSLLLLFLPASLRKTSARFAAKPGSKRRVREAGRKDQSAAAATIGGLTVGKIGSARAVWDVVESAHAWGIGQAGSTELGDPSRSSG